MKNELCNMTVIFLLLWGKNLESFVIDDTNEKKGIPSCSARLMYLFLQSFASQALAARVRPRFEFQVGHSNQSTSLTTALFKNTPFLNFLCCSQLAVTVASWIVLPICLAWCLEDRKRHAFLNFMNLEDSPPKL